MLARDHACVRRVGVRACTAVVLLLHAATTVAAGAPRIVNGLPTHDFPTTGVLLHATAGPIGPDDASMVCSGTLIGCRTFLTAAHCIAGDLDASHYAVYLQHAGVVAAAAVAVHPTYDATLSGHDVATVTLANEVTGVAPTPINATHDLAATGVGLAATIVGFGLTAITANDVGIKRYGAVQTADCPVASTGGEGNDKLVCWDFAIPVGPPGQDSDTCNGDSGGPLFIDFGGMLEVAGVTSTGTSPFCRPLDHSWDASVYFNATWIAAQIGTDATTTCGDIGPVGGPDATVVATSGTLAPAHASDTFALDVPAGTAVLRVALNGQQNGIFDADLYVRHGTTVDPASYDCRAVGLTVFGGCELPLPTPGPWSVLVAATSGAGAYQVTSTMFAGPPPVCGNGVTEPGEQCDGTSDAACPGRCAPDCTCPPACASGDLHGSSLVSTASRLRYRATLDDRTGRYAALDPRNGFAAEVSDGLATVRVAIPAGDPGWTKSNAARRRFGWQGDGSLGGLRSVQLRYRTSRAGNAWTLSLRGRDVPNAGVLDLARPLLVTLTVDGVCTLERR